METWVTRDGRVVKFTDMGDEHLRKKHMRYLMTTVARGALYYGLR